MRRRAGRRAGAGGAACKHRFVDDSLHGTRGVWRDVGWRKRAWRNGFAARLHCLAFHYLCSFFIRGEKTRRITVSPSSLPPDGGCARRSTCCRMPYAAFSRRYSSQLGGALSDLFARHISIHRHLAGAFPSWHAGWFFCQAGMYPLPAYVLRGGSLAELHCCLPAFYLAAFGHSLPSYLYGANRAASAVAAAVFCAHCLSLSTSSYLPCLHHAPTCHFLSEGWYACFLPVLSSCLCPVLPLLLLACCAFLFCLTAFSMQNANCLYGLVCLNMVAYGVFRPVA